MKLKKLLGVLLSALVLLCCVSCKWITKWFGEIYNVTISVNNKEWGNSNFNMTNVAKEPGDEVLFIAFPNPGYKVDRTDWLEEKDFEITEISENTWSFSMPSHNVTITIYFEAVEPEPEPEPEPELPKLAITDGNSINGIKLNFANIPEDAERRYIFLGSENDRIKIDEKAEWNNPDNVKETTYFYPFTTKDKNYEFYVYYEKKDGTKLAEATVTITAKGGLGDFEVTNHENIKIAIDKDGNLSYETKPNVIENINSEKQIVYCIQGWDSVFPWVNAGDAWFNNDEEGYFWVGKWDWKNAGEAVSYDNFNVIDYICTAYSDNPEKNIKVTDSLVKYKGLVLDVNYEIKNPNAENEWYTINIFDHQFFEKGKEGQGVYVIEPSPLLGTWMGKSKAYTFTQNKVIVEDATSKKEYSYTYKDNSVQFNGQTFEYEIDDGRTKLSITEEDDTVKKYSRVCFGKKLEAGYEAAEIKVENNILKFIQTPGEKTIPEGITGYRIDFCTEGADEKDYSILACASFDSLTFNDVNIDQYIWDKKLKNKKLKLHVLWGQDYEKGGWNLICDTIELSNYSVASGYELPETSIDGTVVKMTKPGEKILKAYPNTDHYTVFVYSEANKWEGWLAAKEFELTDEITFDLCDLGINPYDIINGRVNLCLELKSATENCEARLTDNNFVPFDGYKYHVTLSDNTIGMDSGLSLRISGVPAEAKIRDVGIIIDGNWYEINWTDKDSEVSANTFTYPFVKPNTEYEVSVNYYIKDSEGFQSKRIATSYFKTTPTGGSGSIIAVNAPSISGKIEGQIFSWITKPTIMGTHTKGTFNINFFNPETGHYIGGYGKKYTELIDSSYTGFDLAEVYWNDEGKALIKNMSALNVIYQYDANDQSGDYSALPCTVNQNQQSFTELSISIDLAQE